MSEVLKKPTLGLPGAKETPSSGVANDLSAKQVRVAALEIASKRLLTAQKAADASAIIALAKGFEAYING